MKFKTILLMLALFALACPIFAQTGAPAAAPASSVTWIAPYFGYARSDKRRGGANSSNGPVLRLRFASAKLRSG